MTQAQPVTPHGDLDQLAVDTIRTLCIDMIEVANSGHPGTPIGIAPVTYTLWQRFLRYDPGDPVWPAWRSRGGHAHVRRLGSAQGARQEVRIHI